MTALLVGAFAPAGAHALDPVLSDTEKKDAIIAMLEAWVPYAESYYVSGPPSYYDVGGDGVSLERGEACIALIIATLLRAEPSARTIGGLSRRDMEDRLEIAIDDVISSHDSVLGSTGWGGRITDADWQGPTVAAAAGWAAQLAWSTLDATTQRNIERVVAAEAQSVLDWEPEGFQTTENGNSGLEENLNYAYVRAVGAAGSA